MRRNDMERHADGWCVHSVPCDGARRPTRGALLARVGARIRDAANDEAAAAILEEELGELLGLTVDERERVDLQRRMARHVRASQPKPHGVVLPDFYGAFASFWLVFFGSIPAAGPFLFIDDAWIALRVSNLILILLLFVTGVRWARYTLLRPWLTGLVFMVTGVGLVYIAGGLVAATVALIALVRARELLDLRAHSEPIVVPADATPAE